MTIATGTQIADLHARMVDHLVAAGWLQSDRVEQAMRTVRRHAFLPAATLEAAYANETITTKPGPNGRPLSCASQPRIVAMMLQQLDVHPGQSILEIGAGTGYNAALLAELVGTTGEVTTVDIDPEVTAHARRALNSIGYGRVQVATQDGALGEADHAPYDGIIVTVGPWDLAPAWSEQLATGGRLVVPLSWRGQSRSILFTQEGTHLRSEDSQLCGFIPMRSPGQDGERTGHVDSDGHVTLCWDADQPIDPASLAGVLAQPKTTLWSGATVGAYEPVDGIWLRLTGTEPGTCRITTAPAAVEAGLCTPAFLARSAAVVEGDSLAYLAHNLLDPGAADRRWEYGAIGHGPAGPELAARICEQIRTWDRDRTAQPIITAHPVDTPDDKLPKGLVIDKRHTRIVITY